MSVIEVRELRKVYGNGRVALDSLSFEVGQGQVFGFLGPNGAGKTTAVKIFVGLILPTSGEVRVFGFPPGDTAGKARFGFLPEHFRFYDWLTGRELLELHGRLAGLDGKRGQRRRVEVLRLVGLSEAADTPIRNYSKGMQQRIGIAQCLLHEPELVLLDEPTSALDPLGRREVRDLVRGLKSQGVTVFLNSHLLSEVELICDHLAIIDRGRVVKSGRLESLLAGEQVLRVVVDRLTEQLRDRLARIGRVCEVNGNEVVLAINDADLAPLVAQAVFEAGLRLYALIPVQRQLEDIFVGAVDGASL